MILQVKVEPTEEVVERVARAICDSHLCHALGVTRKGLDGVPKESVRYYCIMQAARAAIAALMEGSQPK